LQHLANNPASVQVTLGEQAMTLQSGGELPGQVNFFIPANFPTGIAILRLSNGGIAANPIAVQIDVAPPTILSVNNASGVPFDSSRPAYSQDVVIVYVSGLDAGVVANPSRLQVNINGRPMPVQSVTPGANGQTQISFVLSQGFGGTVVSLTVVVDGSASAPFGITVR